VASDAPSDTRRVTGDQVNLRQEPDVGSASLALLSLDDPVEVLEAQGSWLRVRTQDGQEGWVAARFAAEDPN
jgi:SH3-like domain-containing protein